MGRRERPADIRSEVDSDAFHLGDSARTPPSPVPVDGDLLPLDRTPKILGVTFDPHFHFHKHVEIIEEMAKQRLSLMKVLTGTTCGANKRKH